MKNTLFTLALTLIAALTFSGSKAQKAMNKGMEGYIDPYVFMVSGKVTAAPDITSAENKVGLEAKENFKKQFPLISDARWHEAVDGGFVVHFEKDEIHTMVAYNKKGKWHHTINYYEAAKLEQKIFESVKSTYPMYDVLHISEVQFNQEKVYMIILQGQRFLKQIRFQDNEIEEIASYSRG